MVFRICLILNIQSKNFLSAFSEYHFVGNYCKSDKTNYQFAFLWIIRKMSKQEIHKFETQMPQLHSES